MNKFTEEMINEGCAAVRTLAEEINALPGKAFSELPADRTALIVIDIVNGFIREGAMASPYIESIVAPSAALMEKFRNAGMPIAVFADCHKKNCAEFSSFPEHCLENTAESEPVDEIKAVGGYTLIKKNSTNGFHEKDFRAFLDAHPETDTFVVIGDCTDICVLQFCLGLKTYFNCTDMQSEIMIPADCAETYDAPNHSAAFTDIAAYKLMSDSGIRFVRTIN